MTQVHIQAFFYVAVFNVHTIEWLLSAAPSSMKGLLMKVRPVCADVFPPPFALRSLIAALGRVVFVAADCLHVITACGDCVIECPAACAALCFVCAVVDDFLASRRNRSRTQFWHRS